MDVIQEPIGSGNAVFRFAVDQGREVDHWYRPLRGDVADGFLNRPECPQRADVFLTRSNESLACRLRVVRLDQHVAAQVLCGGVARVDLDCAVDSAQGPGELAGLERLFGGTTVGAELPQLLIRQAVSMFALEGSAVAQVAGRNHEDDFCAGVSRDVDNLPERGPEVGKHLLAPSVVPMVGVRPEGTIEDRVDVGRECCPILRFRLAAQNPSRQRKRPRPTRQADEAANRLWGIDER